MFFWFPSASWSFWSLSAKEFHPKNLSLHRNVLVLKERYWCYWWLIKSWVSRFWQKHFFWVARRQQFSKPWNEQMILFMKCEVSYLTTWFFSESRICRPQKNHNECEVSGKKPWEMKCCCHHNMRSQIVSDSLEF